TRAARANLCGSSGLSVVTLGSRGCEPVVGGSLPPTLIGVNRENGCRCVRQAAERGRLAACAPRKEQRDERATQNFGRGRARSFLRAHSFTSQTPSFDSSSPSRSRTLSSGAVGKFFPTYSARIG